MFALVIDALSRIDLYEYETGALIMLQSRFDR